MTADDPDFSARDLLMAIKSWDFPKWTVSIQVMPETDADTYKWNPFDLTKVWPHGDYLLMELGEMELNRVPENHFAEVEQAAFEPLNIVPGISFSPDKVLQNRTLSYADAHRYRIGVNYDHIPVNQAKAAKVYTYYRDGNMVTGDNGGGLVDYEPNSFGGPVEDKSTMEPPLKIDGNGGRYTTYPGDDADLYSQPRALWEKVLDDTGRAHLVANIVGSMSEPAMGMTDDAKRHEIQQRMLKHGTRFIRTLARRSRRVSAASGQDGGGVVDPSRRRWLASALFCCGCTRLSMARTRSGPRSSMLMARQVAGR